jgi:hypothetical protein
MPMSTKCQKKRKKKTINAIQHDDKVCLNSKFPPAVELCWQNKNISKLGIVITKVGNIIILETT